MRLRLDRMGPCIAAFALIIPLVAAPYRTRVNDRDRLVYVWIPAGVFLMGCSPGDTDCFQWEMTAHSVVIQRGFWIGQTLVTQRAWTRVMGSNPSRYPNPESPVDQVSWNDAAKFCALAGMRLPTETEWEYAARAGSANSRYGLLEAIAWYDGNSENRTHPVAKKLPNAFTLYDMLGNVWEWVQDIYSNGGINMRRLRGGSFFNSARDIRLSNFLWAAPETAHRDMGVRCVGD